MCLIDKRIPPVSKTPVELEPEPSVIQLSMSDGAFGVFCKYLSQSDPSGRFWLWVTLVSDLKTAFVLSEAAYVSLHAFL